MFRSWAKSVASVAVLATALTGVSVSAAQGSSPGPVSTALRSASAVSTPQLTEVGAPFGLGGSYNGWVLDSNTTGDVWSSPAVGDVTGDGRPEVIVGGLDSIVRIYGIAANGSTSLMASIDPGGSDRSRRIGATQASPALGDINGDGVLDIVLANTGGILSAYSFKGGVVTQINRQYVPPGFQGAIEGIFGTPALGYINGDANLDVVTGTWGQEVDAWAGPSFTKIPSSHEWMKDTIWSSPAIGDVDGDGQPDIVIGSDCDGSGALQPCYGTSGGGYITAFRLDGSVIWSHFEPRAVIWSSPALADLNGDGALDVVVGTGLYFNGAEARKVLAINGKNGTNLWQGATSGAVVGSPSIGDVNGDGKPEVFVVSRGGRLFSWNSDGTQRYNVCIDDANNCSGSEYGTHGGVALADINNDGQVDAITQAEQNLIVFNAATGAREVVKRSAYPHTIFSGSSTPTVANIDGKAWVFVASRGDWNGNNSRDDNDELVVTAWKSSTALGAAPWPTFKQNMFRTGTTALPVAPNPVTTQKFVKQVYQDFLARPASSDDINAWTPQLMNHTVTPYGVATQLSLSDEWITTVITNFYRDTLNRAPDAAGLRSWINAARGGMPIAQIASAFYSSNEYFSSVGKNDYATWVTDLYRKLLSRAPDDAGLNSWVRLLQSGTSRDTVSIGFYQSQEKLAVRITVLYQKLLGRAPEPNGVSNWTPFVRDNGDLVLAAAIAGSPEYFNRAQTLQ